MGFEYWEVGFGKQLGWEMGLVPPLQDPHKGAFTRQTMPVKNNVAHRGKKSLICE